MTNVIESETLLLVEGTCAYLATTRDPHVSVGVAAKKGVWNFTHDAFNKIREFLSRLDAR